ncbi:ABC transporter ATP-binding protein [Laceyella putida]|uniref:ABC transporter ATP-binding protein n=1 Tax=Laceyella putida TaxID=110101 RepID=A0ABW2RMC4_9BACL
MFRLQGVTVKMGKEVALFPLTWEIRRGKIYGIVGSDGAGKTTLIKTLVGLVKPTSGQLSLDRGTRIGFVPEHFGLYEEMSIAENILFTASLNGVAADVAQERMPSLLELTGLAPYSDRLARSLSGGMKRKLAMICAMIHEPGCFILDEPTNGVDPVSRREIWQLIRTYRDKGATVIVSTQYLDEVIHCDEVLFLHQGRMLMADAPKRILEQFPYEVWALKKMRQVPLSEMREFREISGVVELFQRGTDWIAYVNGSADLRESAAQRGYRLERIPPLVEDVLIRLIKEGAIHDTTV